MDRDEEILRVPVIEETVEVGKREVETGTVRIQKNVEVRREIVRAPSVRQTVSVRRVQVNRVIDQPVPVRHEGDTTIIPIFEEQVVIQKRLVLKEELHITRSSKVRQERIEVPLRSESVTVERIESD